MPHEEITCTIKNNMAEYLNVLLIIPDDDEIKEDFSFESVLKEYI